MSRGWLKILILVFLFPKSSFGFEDAHKYHIDTSINNLFKTPPCIDTLTRLRLVHADYNLTTNFITEISGESYLSAGYTSARNPPYRIGGLLTKVNAQGDPLWTRSFFRVNNVGSVNFGKTHELPNKEIIVAGSSYISRPVNGTDDLLLIKTNAVGDIVWYRTFQSTVRTDTTAGSFLIKQILSDDENNFYVLGDIRPTGLSRYIMVIKFDQDANIIWQKAINLIDLPTIAGAFLKKNELWIFGHLYSSALSFVPLMIRMNASNGDTLSFKALYPDFPPPASAYNMAPLLTGVTELNDGNFSFHGVGGINGAYFINGRNTVAVNMKVDSSFNFINAYRITAGFLGSGTQTTIGVSPRGNAAIHTGFRVANNDMRAYYLHVDNNQLTSQRYIPFSDYSFGFTPQPVFMKDASRLFFQTVINNNGKGEIMFYKSQLSNRASDCAGRDTSLFQLEEFTYKPLNLNLKPAIISDFLQRTYYTALAASETIFPVKENLCAQTSFCDTLFVRRISPTVCISAPLQLTVVKNSECGAVPTWFLDSSIATIKKNTDTTFEFSFKKTWKGYIKAQIIGRCGLLEDSIYLDVVASPTLPSLGIDRTICPGNTIRLNLPSGYAATKWQDGSTDSFYLVTQPGTYYVSVTDYCNNNFTDTVQFTSAGAIPFNVGDQFTKCDNETITIKAPDGFIDYTWSPNKGINTITGQSVDIQVDTDTRYFISAQKEPGCFVYDTIQVTVKPSININLGNDTTVCDGQPLMLDAGSGFLQYQWSNQAVTAAINVLMAGKYTVQATASNGCISKDTIQVTLSNTPKFTLGQDTSICANTEYVLQPQIGPEFFWQDGSRDSKFKVQNAGLYWLEVNDKGCVFRDSINIAIKSLPYRSLPIDTLLCDQASLLLNPSALNDSRVNYLWSDGSTTGSKTISTSGSYSVIMNRDGCTINDTAKVTFKFSPVFSLGKDTVICENSSLQLNAFVSGATYLWSNFSTNASIVVQTPGLYTCVVSNECGVSRDEIIVRTEVCECSITMPNAFTPNADGIHDVLKPFINCVPASYQMLIFNRNGTLIFESNTTSLLWDGTFKGTPVPVGTYYYLVKVKGSSDKIAKEKSGTVLLLR